MICFKLNPVAVEPSMGDLPVSRVTQSRPFASVGIDYGGPFIVKESKLRKPRMFKIYLALFVCMTTHAIHLEIVTELTTVKFLDALDRFIARRGIATHIYSDNATNFVGANNDIQKFLRNQETQDAITDHLSAKGINWHFAPLAAPSFGGIYEAGIKSA